MIFLDTGYLLALFHQEDSLHLRALAWSEAITERPVTTEYVLIESVNAFSKPPHRPAANALARFVCLGIEIEFLPASHELLMAGLALHRSRPDKEWSLTDCISFHVMETRGMSRALAHDRHFEQAGFEALLRCDPPSRPLSDAR